jgi:tRNA(adenine34) deaminase
VIATSVEPAGAAEVISTGSSGGSGGPSTELAGENLAAWRTSGPAEYPGRLMTTVVTRATTRNVRIEFFRTTPFPRPLDCWGNPTPQLDRTAPAPPERIWPSGSQVSPGSRTIPAPEYEDFRAPIVTAVTGLDDHAAMGIALEEAALAATHGDVPVGAIALVRGAVVAQRHNERELRGDPTAHAEILALAAAAAVVGSWRLTDVTLVVTLEPCPMCAGAAVAARLGRLVFGAADPKAGACGSLYNLSADPRLNHEFPVTAGVRAGECGQLLTEFFAAQRR